MGPSCELARSKQPPANISFRALSNNRASATSTGSMEGTIGDSSQSTISAWTLIATAQGQGKPAADALGALLMQYRPFIIWTLGKLRPPPDKEMDELFQAYAFPCVRTELVKGLERYGSLRGFLKRSLGFFVMSEWTEYQKRQRQVPGDWEPSGWE